MDARHHLDPRPCFVDDDRGGGGIAGDATPRHVEQAGDEGEIVRDAVLQLLKHRPLLLGQRGRDALFRAQTAKRAMHQVDQPDIDHDDENVEAERQRRLSVQREAGGRYEPVPGRQPAQHGADRASADAAEKRGDDDGREKGQVGETWREPAIDSQSRRQRQRERAQCKRERAAAWKGRGRVVGEQDHARQRSPVAGVRRQAPRGRALAGKPGRADDAGAPELEAQVAAVVAPQSGAGRETEFALSPPSHWVRPRSAS